MNSHGHRDHLEVHRQSPQDLIGNVLPGDEGYPQVSLQDILQPEAVLEIEGLVDVQAFPQRRGGGGIAEGVIAGHDVHHIPRDNPEE